MSRMLIMWMAIASFCLVASSNQLAAQSEFSTINGDTMSFTQLAVANDGSVIVDGEPTGLTIDDLREVSFGRGVRGVGSGAVEIFFRGGGSVYGRQFALVEESCRFEIAGRSYEVGVEYILGVRLDAEEQSDLFERGLAQPLEESDRIYFRIDGQLQSTEGIIESISDGEAAFQFSDTSTRLPYSRFYGVVIADFGEAAPEPGNATVTLVEGAVVNGQLISHDASELLLRVGGGYDLVLDMSQVSGYVVRSNKLAFLSDLTPVRAQVTPILTPQRDWMRDASVAGGPLQLQSLSTEQVFTYAKGIGTHSDSIIEYSNSEGFDRLAATIGIDASTKGRGDCEFVIVGDGRELFRQRVTGIDEPRPIEVDISGCRSISLVVEAGNQLDLVITQIGVKQG